MTSKGKFGIDLASSGTPATILTSTSWTGKQIPPPKQPKHTPKPPAKKTGALAVEVAKSAGIVVHF